VLLAVALSLDVSCRIALACTSNPLGVKGAGEGAIIPIGGLMANAVANALASFGAMPNQLPISPARVWQMRKSRSAKCTFTARGHGRQWRRIDRQFVVDCRRHR
jgi:hypothetical protein